MQKHRFEEKEHFFQMNSSRYSQMNTMTHKTQLSEWEKFLRLVSIIQFVYISKNKDLPKKFKNRFGAVKKKVSACGEFYRRHLTALLRGSAHAGGGHLNFTHLRFLVTDGVSQPSSHISLGPNHNFFCFTPRQVKLPLTKHAF